MLKTINYTNKNTDKFRIDINTVFKTGLVSVETTVKCLFTKSTQILTTGRNIFF